MRSPRALHIVGDTMWIALREGNSVWKLNLKDKQLTHIAGTGAKGYSGDGGPAKAATFDGPKGIVAGSNNDVYVMDTENQAVRKIDLATGVISTIAGTGPKGRGLGGDGGSATAAVVKMDRPHGITVDAKGAVFIGDTNNHRVRKIDYKTGLIATFAGSEKGFGGDGGPANQAKFSGIYCATLDPANRTLVKVQMNDAGAADDMFRVLMGDKVEPRRDFIEKHAMDVRNLDV